VAGVVVAGAQMGIAHQLALLAAQDEHHLGVGLEPYHAVDHHRAGLLQAAGQLQVGLLVEARAPLPDSADPLPAARPPDHLARLPLRLLPLAPSPPPPRPGSSGPSPRACAPSPDPPRGSAPAASPTPGAGRTPPPATVSAWAPSSRRPASARRTAFIELRARFD